MGTCCVNELSEIPEHVDPLLEGVTKPEFVFQQHASTSENQVNVEDLKGVVIDFWDERSSSMVHQEFASRPLGMSYKNEVPLIVATIDVGSTADKLGIQTGWVIKAINGRRLSGTTFEKDTNQFRNQIKGLPETVDPFGEEVITKPAIVAQLEANTGGNQAKVEA